MAPPMLVWGARNNPGRTFVVRPCSDDAEKTSIGEIEREGEKENELLLLFPYLGMRVP